MTKRSLATVDSNAFFECLAQDPSLEEKFHQCDSLESVMALAKSNGFTLSTRNIKAFMEESYELSDDAVADLAGGFHGDRSPISFLGSKPQIAARLSQLGLGL